MYESEDMGFQTRLKLGCRRSVTSATRFARQPLGRRSATGHLPGGEELDLRAPELDVEIDVDFDDGGDPLLQLLDDLRADTQVSLSALERVFDVAPSTDEPMPVRRLREHQVTKGFGRRPAFPRRIGGGTGRRRSAVVPSIHRAPAVAYHRMPGGEVDEAPFQPPGSPVEPTA